MKRSTYHLSILVLIAMFLASCGSLSIGNSGGSEVDAAPPPSAAVATTENAPVEVTIVPNNSPVADTNASAGQGEPYRIGALLALTGDSSTLGEPQKETIELLRDQINAAGGILGPDGLQHPLEVIIKDDATDDATAVAAAKELIDQGVLAIIGSSSTDQSMAIIPTLMEAQTPMLSLAASPQIVEPVEERSWIFRPTFGNGAYLRSLASDLNGRGLTDVAFVYRDNDFGNTAYNLFQEIAQEEGINIIYVDKFADGVNDMTQQMQGVAGSNAKAMIAWSALGQAIPVAQSFAGEGLTIPAYFSQGIGTQRFIEEGGVAAEGSRFVGIKLLVAEELSDSDPQRALLLKYTNDYTERYNKPVANTGAYAYDAFNIVTQALSRSGPDRAKLRNEIERTQNFVGASGVFNMSAEDHVGLDISTLITIEVRDGAWRIRPRGGARG